MKDLRQCSTNPNHWYFQKQTERRKWYGVYLVRPPNRILSGAIHKTTSPVSIRLVLLKRLVSQSPCKSPNPRNLQSCPHRLATGSSTKATHPNGYAPGLTQSIRDRYKETQGESPVYRFKGKRYRYKLEFSVVKSYKYKLQFSVMKKFLKRSWGSVVVYRKPRTWYWKKING